MDQINPQGTLTVRKPRFCLDDVPPIWDTTGPYKTSIINAFSFVAPTFEKTACVVVREAFTDIRNGSLLADARSFVQQEAQHSLVHQLLNEHLFNSRLGAVRQHIAHLLKGAENDFSRLDPKSKLATVAAGEHIICCFSCWILDDSFNASMHPTMRNLYLWHSLEEVEHASISFDIFSDLYGSSVSSYCCRVLGYVRAIRYVMGRLLKIYLLVVEELAERETLLQRCSRRATIVMTGIVKSIPFLLYFAPFFHPSVLKPRHFDHDKPRHEDALSRYMPSVPTSTPQLEIVESGKMPGASGRSGPGL